MKIVGAQVLGPDFQFHNYTVEVQEDTITALNDAASQETSCDVVSYSGLKLIPGLIDTHMHGFYGKDCETKDPEDLSVISYRLAKEGWPAYVPAAWRRKKIKVPNCWRFIWRVRL